METYKININPNNEDKRNINKHETKQINMDQ